MLKQLRRSAGGDEVGNQLVRASAGEHDLDVERAVCAHLRVEVGKVLEVLTDDEQVTDALVDGFELLDDGTILRIAHEEADAPLLTRPKHSWGDVEVEQVRSVVGRRSADHRHAAL